MFSGIILACSIANLSNCEATVSSVFFAKEQWCVESAERVATAINDAGVYKVVAYKCVPWGQPL